MRLSQRLQAVAPSGTIAVTTEIFRLRGEGVRVLNFGAGEPDFETPERIGEAARRAIAEGQTRYTPAAGLLELREAIAAKMWRLNQLEVSPEQVVATTGGKHALSLGLLALLDPGDEVLIPVPFWTSYGDMVRLAGGVPVFLPTSPEDGFKLRPEQLAAAVGPRTRALLLNSPSNPTGAVYSASELQAIGEVLVAAPEVALLTDEVYELLHFVGQRPPHLLGLHPELRERSLIINSVSKSYAMTGWRVGYAVGPQAWIDGIVTLQGQTTTGTSSISQVAAAEALRGGADEESMVAEFRRRRDFTCARWHELPGVSLVNPEGAFYVFPDVRRLLEGSAAGRQVATSMRLCELLLEQERVALVPGEAFGAPGYLRMAYTASLDALEEGMGAIERVFDHLAVDLRD
jgi:aspartate aminotransferase